VVLLGLARALPAMKVLMAQTALPVPVMPPLILPMTGLLQIKETSTA
jgi:hypothetical protein